MTEWAYCLVIVEPEDGVMMYFAPGNAYASWDFISNNQLRIKFQVTNSCLSQTVKAFEIYVYATDVWGNILYGDSVYYMTTTKNVNPGAVVYTDNIVIPQANSIKRVYCGIHKVLYEDGSVATAKTVDYDYWDVKK